MFPFRQAVEVLLYLMSGARPDIAYAVGVVSRKLENPTDHNIIRVNRIFRYLRGTTDCKLVYKNNGNVYGCYSNADHRGDSDTGRSTSLFILVHVLTS